MKATLIILLIFNAAKTKSQTPETHFLFEVTPVIIEAKEDFYLSEIAVPFKSGLYNLDFMEAIKKSVPDSGFRSILADVQGDKNSFIGFLNNFRKQSL